MPLCAQWNMYQSLNQSILRRVERCHKMYVNICSKHCKISVRLSSHTASKQSDVTFLFPAPNTSKCNSHQSPVKTGLDNQMIDIMPMNLSQGYGAEMAQRRRGVVTTAPSRLAWDRWQIAANNPCGPAACKAACMSN